MRRLKGNVQAELSALCLAYDCTSEVAAKIGDG